MSDYEGVDNDEGADPDDPKGDELRLDALDEAKREEEAAAAGDDEECAGGYLVDGEPVHCGDDCNGSSSNDGTGERWDPEDCVGCDCCGSWSAIYARVA